MTRVTEVKSYISFYFVGVDDSSTSLNWQSDGKSYRSFYFVGVDDVRHFCIHDIDAWHEALGLHNMRLLAS
jgi:hypothetical protein